MSARTEKMLAVVGYLAFACLSVYVLSGMRQDTPNTADFCQRNCQPAVCK